MFFKKSGCILGKLLFSVGGGGGKRVGRRVKRESVVGEGEPGWFPQLWLSSYGPGH